MTLQYTPLKRFATPELDEWGRKGQPIEFLTTEEAFGKKAIEYKQNPRILFIYLQIGLRNIDPLNHSKRYYIQFQTNAWRYDPAQSPYKNYTHACLIDAHAGSERINKDLSRCIGPLEPRMFHFD